VLDEEVEEFMLERELWDDEAYVKHFNVAEHYADTIAYHKTMLDSKLECLLDSNRARVDSPSRENVDTERSPNLKLPQVELPKFNNEPEEFVRFRTSFEQMISKFKLTEFEKYMYLVQCTSGSSRKIVESVPSGNLSYSSAISLLSDAYSSKVSQQYSVIDKLIKLKLTNSKQCLKWISEARVLSDQVDKLEIDGKTFTQYFLWTNMSEVYKRQFISLVDSSKPGLKVIIDKSFEVFKRVGEYGDPHCEKQKSCFDSVVLATKVEPSGNSN